MSQSVKKTSYDANDFATKNRLRLWLKLLKLSRQVESELRDSFRVEFQTTLPRFDVMAALYRFPKGLLMNELSEALKVSNGNVTGIVDRLVKDALLIRTAVPGDRRALRVKLTAAGKKEFLKQAIQHESWVDILLSDITADDADLMIALLDKADAKNLQEPPEQ